MTNEITQKNPRVVMRPAVAETIRSIKPGEAVTFRCTELAPYNSAIGTVSKENTAAGRTEYTITTTDNGASYTISRMAAEPTEV